MTIKRFYWDSCAFIHFFQGSSDYIEALDYMDQKSQAGTSTIVTCAVSLAEVCKLPELGMLPLEQTQKILRFMENDYIEMWQADRLVCEEAHQIIRHHQLKPMDAIHVATALIAKVDVFMTTDMKKYRRDSLLGKDGSIGNPPLKIKRPEMKALLPLWEAAADDTGNNDEEEGTTETTGA